MSNPIQPTILVIIGITGDLSHRYLLPAVREIAQAGLLPEHFRLVGVSRRDINLDEIVAPEDTTLRNFLEIFQMDLTSVEDYRKLGERLDQIGGEFGDDTQRLFYLSVPPQVSQPVVEMLGESGLAARANTKLLLEKPFGVDLTSAEELVDGLNAHFKEEQVYRIDHYLAKEMAQNLIVFRNSNALFKHTWNNQFIDQIEIVVTEAIGIEGRAAFYEQTGALRDVMQSHLLQLAALTLMDLPESGDWTTVPSKRLEALKQLIPPTVPDDVTRGQYEGYKDEVQNPHSNTETYVSMCLYSSNPRWAGVPITLTTGKALSRKASEIHVRYHGEGGHEANTLTFRIQPNEGVEVCLWSKKPGLDREVQRVALDFSYNTQTEKNLPDAYEQVFIDAMRSDHTLFTTSQEVLASWHILAPIQKCWENTNDDLKLYPVGADHL